MATPKNFRKNYSIEPTISTSAYSAGDAIGGLEELASVAGTADQSGLLRQILVLDESAQSADIDFFFFQKEVTSGTDNAAFAPSATDMQECIGKVSVLAADYAGLPGVSLATVLKDLHFQMDASTSVYVQAVAQGTPTYSATDSLKLKFVFEADSRTSSL